MNHYEVWVNLAPGTDDLEFDRAARAYLDFFVAKGLMAEYRIRRRKFGFGPESLGEWNITMSFRSLALMDEAFAHAATRTGEIEALHAEVYRRVVDFKSALYRDFPDDVRAKS